MFCCAVLCCFVLLCGILYYTQEYTIKSDQMSISNVNANFNTNFNAKLNTNIYIYADVQSNFVFTFKESANWASIVNDPALAFIPVFSFFIFILLLGWTHKAEREREKEKTKRQDSKRRIRLGKAGKEGRSKSDETRQGKARRGKT